MSKLELLTKTIELAEKRDEEEKELEKRYGKDKVEKDETGFKTMILEPKKERQAEYVNAPRPRAAQLESFVKSQSDEDIVYVAAVMYGGRDYWLYKEPPQKLDDVIEELKFNHPDDLRELIHNILGEELLAEYLKAGTDFYKIT
jgi:hypothetical protein